MANDADSDDWKFSVDEVGPDANAETNGQPEGEVALSKGEVPSDLVEDGQEEGNVAGTLTSVGPIEPGTPEMENALFVVLGVYLGVFGIVAMFAPSLFSSVQNVLLLAGGVLVIALFSFGVFGLLTPDT